jgi:hydroxymethylglutaryl-CoA lyase
LPQPPVKIVESPRRAWQSFARPVPPEIAADYLRILTAAGFEHIDAVSFVSPEAMPAMSEAERVLELLGAARRGGANAELIALVANARGAERAVRTGVVETLAFSYSISPGFLDRNQRQTPQEALEQLEQIGEIAYKAGLEVVAHLAMAFGNPYGDAWDVDEVVSAADLLVDAGVEQIVLDDTAGLADPRLLADVLTLVFSVHERLDIGLSIRSEPDAAAEKVRAAYDAGCRRFHAVLGGVGGGEFAQPSIRNLDTELLLRELRSLNAPLPDLEPLDRLRSAMLAMGSRFAG